MKSNYTSWGSAVMASKKKRGNVLSSHHDCEHAIMYIRDGDILEVIDSDGLMAILESDNQISEEDLCYARIDWAFIKFEIGSILLCLECEQLEESLNLKVLHKEKIYDCIAYINNFNVIASAPNIEIELDIDLNFDDEYEEEKYESEIINDDEIDQED
jgi:hypothetical protein